MGVTFSRSFKGGGVNHKSVWEESKKNSIKPKEVVVQLKFSGLEVEVLLRSKFFESGNLVANLLCFKPPLRYARLSASLLSFLTSVDPQRTGTKVSARTRIGHIVLKIHLHRHL